MTGLTSSGFVPETYSNIKGRIEAKLDSINPGFDFSPESPDGQLIGIMSYEIFQVWAQLGNVYNSYNPAIASGAALRNIGLITGIPFGAASKSYVTLETQGTDGTIIPTLTLFSDAAGNEFYTTLEVAIPSNVQAISKNAGVLDVSAGTVTTIVTPVTGLTSVTQTTDGKSGKVAQTQQQYRNTRQRTVMRNSTSLANSMRADLLELGIEQASVFNNDTDAVVNGVPANSIEVTVGELDAGITDLEIANVILNTISLGCATHGTTSVTVTDAQGFGHVVKFTKAIQLDVEIDLNITFLDPDFAGAEEAIQSSLTTYINSLEAGEDVIWSRLFAYITPYGEAQINSLTLGELGGTLITSNLVVAATDYPNIVTQNINITVV